MAANIASPTHLLLIVVVLLLVFGAKKLPELGRGIGQGMREFKSGIAGEENKQAVHASSGVEPAAAPARETVGAGETN